MGNGATPWVFPAEIVLPILDFLAMTFFTLILYVCIFPATREQENKK